MKAVFTIKTIMVVYNPKPLNRGGVIHKGKPQFSLER